MYIQCLPAGAHAQHTTTKHSEMQPRHVQCLHRIRMTYPLEIRKYNRSESSDKNHRMVEKKSWKSVNGKPFPAIATCFWKIERAVWSSGNIPFTVLTSFNFKVVIAERITMESQKKEIWWTSQQGTENSIFRVIFRIRFEVITTMIVKITIFIADFFKIQSSDSPTPTMESQKKKSVEPRSREQSTAYSELSFELGSRLSLWWLCKLPLS